MAEKVIQVIETAAESIKSAINPTPVTMTTTTSCPIAHNKHSLTAGIHGPVLLQDVTLLDKIGHFVREKIPARNVHALGTGAYGTLTVTNDITKYTFAKLFSYVGKKTELFTRFSGIFTEQGDADTSRDGRGFALKFYTEEGNWDLLAINTPVFNVRDGKMGPDAVHAFKRDPVSGNWNPTQTWDYVANHPESFHLATMLYSDRSIPASYRTMHAYGCNTFSFINQEKRRFWVKFHILSLRGAVGLDQTTAKLVAGEDPNFLSRDLLEAINRKDYPRWKFCCQIMPEAEGYTKDFAFDCTKVWKHKDYPLIDIGVIELNRNPIDYFPEVEQVAFSPANIVPGIGFSPDRLLQGRLLIYGEAQYHRIGPNYQELPINRAKATTCETYYNVGGSHQLEISKKFPHYYPSTYSRVHPDQKYLEPPLTCDGNAAFYDYPIEGTDDDYYAQTRDLLKVMSEKEKRNLFENVSTSLAKVTEEVVTQVLKHLYAIDTSYGSNVEALWRTKVGSKVLKSEPEKTVEKVNSMLVNMMPLQSK